MHYVEKEKEMTLQAMETAPKNRDILVYCMFKPWEGSCPFHGFTVAGYDKEQNVWNSIGYNNRGFPLHVVPFGWMELPREIPASMIKELQAFTEEQFDAATKTIYSEM